MSSSTTLDALDTDFPITSLKFIIVNMSLITIRVSSIFLKLSNSSTSFDSMIFNFWIELIKLLSFKMFFSFWIPSLLSSTVWDVFLFCWLVIFVFSIIKSISVLVIRLIKPLVKSRFKRNKIASFPPLIDARGVFNSWVIIVDISPIMAFFSCSSILWFNCVFSLDFFRIFLSRLSLRVIIFSWSLFLASCSFNFPIRDSTRLASILNNDTCRSLKKFFLLCSESITPMTFFS